jgi:hypothetical protein
MISPTPLHEMPPRHCQLHTPRPKASGNAYQALVDPPHDGKTLSSDGGDERTDGYDNNTIVNANPCDSGPPAPTHSQDIGLQWIGQNILLLEKQIQTHTTSTELALTTASEDNAHLNSKIDSLLQRMDAAWTENTALHEAYHASREETAALKVSRITNDMLLGAIAASTGLWVIGISVMVSYLVITA